MKSFQSGIDEIIQTDRFKNASKADQERMIREVSYTKGTIGKINEMLSVENDNWDIRNDDAISELRNAMLTGDESVQISGGGLDMSISFKNDKGELKTVTLGDIANTNFRLTEDYKDELEKFDDAFIKEAEIYYKESVALGVDPEDIKDSLFDIYKKDLASDKDLLSYAYSNELDPSMQVHSITAKTTCSVTVPPKMASRSFWTPQSACPTLAKRSSLVTSTKTCCSRCWPSIAPPN